MSKRKADGDPKSSREDEQSVADGTIGDFDDWYKDIDEDGTLTHLFSRDGLEGDATNLKNVYLDQQDGNEGDAVVGGLAPGLCGGPSMDVSLDTLVDGSAHSLGATAPTKTSGASVAETSAKAASGSQHFVSILPRGGLANIGDEGAGYKPDERNKRGPYAERRESWTMTSSDPRDIHGKKLSSTASTKHASNRHLPVFEQRELTLSEQVESLEEETKESKPSKKDTKEP